MLRLQKKDQIDPEADIAQHNTECKTDEQIAAQYGYRGGKGRTKRLFMEITYITIVR